MKMVTGCLGIYFPYNHWSTLSAALASLSTHAISPECKLLHPVQWLGLKACSSFGTSQNITALSLDVLVRYHMSWDVSVVAWLAKVDVVDWPALPARESVIDCGCREWLSSRLVFQYFERI